MPFFSKDNKFTLWAKYTNEFNIGEFENWYTIKDMTKPKFPNIVADYQVEWNQSGFSHKAVFVREEESILLEVLSEFTPLYERYLLECVKLLNCFRSVSCIDDWKIIKETRRTELFSYELQFPQLPFIDISVDVYSHELLNLRVIVKHPIQPHIFYLVSSNEIAVNRLILSYLSSCSQYKLHHFFRHKK